MNAISDNFVVDLHYLIIYISQKCIKSKFEKQKLPARIELATFRLLSERNNHCATGACTFVRLHMHIL
jgi:hypothetical protein